MTDRYPSRFSKLYHQMLPEFKSLSGSESSSGAKLKVFCAMVGSNKVCYGSPFKCHDTVS